MTAVAPRPTILPLRKLPYFSCSRRGCALNGGGSSSMLLLLVEDRRRRPPANWRICWYCDKTRFISVNIVGDSVPGDESVECDVDGDGGCSNRWLWYAAFGCSISSFPSWLTARAAASDAATAAAPTVDVVGVSDGDGGLDVCGLRRDRLERRRLIAETKMGASLLSLLLLLAANKLRKLRLRRAERCSDGAGGGDNVMVGCCCCCRCCWPRDSFDDDDAPLL